MLFILDPLVLQVLILKLLCYNHAINYDTI